MKKFLNVIIITFTVLNGFAQNENPVKWNFSSKKINATTYEIHLAAKIEDGWHTYSQTTPDGGPVPTSIEFNRNPLLTFQGTAKESGKLEQHFERLFGVDVKQFSDKVEFIQVVKLKRNNPSASIKTNVSGTVTFMTCNDEECIPPKTLKFSVVLK